jgi:UDP-3-O-[3-hydroxymyristoyl] N-acetylglucosamine deacetylase
MNALRRLSERTLGRTVEVTGIGLHSGRPVRVRLRPGRAGSGIVFFRTDLPGGDRRPIATNANGVTEVDHATTISAGGEGTPAIQTVEHLLSALCGLEIDACRVEVDAPELPILDGSAAPWVYLIHEAGLKTLAAPRKVRRIVRPLRVEMGDAFLAAYPADSLRITCSIDFAHPAIGAQERGFDVNPRSFSEEIAPARTFGFLHEVEALRQAGLVKGGSYDNAIVLDEHGVLNGRLRFQDEFVRHKALDLIGDLALTGLPLVGHLVAHRAGHRVHAEFAKRLLSTPGAWRVEEARPETGVAAAAAMGSSLFGLPAARTLAHPE